MVIPSERGELEITSFNSIYFNKKKLKLQVMSCVYAWLDPCTHESMTEATEFVKVFEKLTNLKNACIEEIVL